MAVCWLSNSSSSTGPSVGALILFAVRRSGHSSAFVCVFASRFFCTCLIHHRDKSVFVTLFMLAVLSLRVYVMVLREKTDLVLRHKESRHRIVREAVLGTMALLARFNPQKYVTLCRGNGYN